MAHRYIFFFLSSRRRHTRWPRDWSSDVCSSDLSCGSGSRSRRTPPGATAPKPFAAEDNSHFRVPPRYCGPDLYSDRDGSRRTRPGELDGCGPLSCLSHSEQSRRTARRKAHMYSLILLNGGIGSRTGADQPKQLLKLRGIPILVYALISADRVEKISQIVVNYPPNWREKIEEVLEAYAISTPVTLVEADDSRHSSVTALIPHCTNDDVIIHESARPLVRRSDLQD